MAEIRINATGGVKLYDADDSHYAQILAGTITSNVDALTLGSSSATFSIPVTVGEDDTGHDVKLFGASAGAYALWDESANLLDLRGATAAGPGHLKLTTGELTVVDADVLGKIEFQAPLESDGTDAILVGAAIWAEADDTFAAGVNNTDLVFALGKSEAAAEKFRFTADTEIGIGGANYGTDGQVLTSGGAGAAVAWEDASGAVTALNNATANELVTVGATTTELEAEAKLLFSSATLTIGNATAEDTKIVFDGNAQDWHIGLDDSADDLVIGLGSTLGTTSHIICDEAGLVTTPLNSSFRVYQSTNTDYDNSDTIFDSNSTENFDTNNDLASGTFTAPVTGIYLFQMSIYDLNASDDTLYDMGLTTSNRGHRFGQRGRFKEGYTGVTSMKVVGSIIADMDANDTAYVYSGNSVTFTNNANVEHAYFSGVLIG